MELNIFAHHYYKYIVHDIYLGANMLPCIPDLGRLYAILSNHQEDAQIPALQEAHTFTVSKRKFRRLYMQLALEQILIFKILAKEVLEKHQCLRKINAGFRNNAWTNSMSSFLCSENVCELFYFICTILWEIQSHISVLSQTSVNLQ